MYYLYVKQHNKTGLKYLGKSHHDPEHHKKYCGSGIYWSRHLKKHGKDISTYVIGSYNTLEEIREAGLCYSKAWNIVESDDWGNLMEEEGIGGFNHITDKLEKKRVKNLRKAKKEYWKQSKIDDPLRKKYALGAKHQIEERIKQGLPCFLNLPDMTGDNNPAKRPEVRKKIKAAWAKRKGLL